MRRSNIPLMLFSDLFIYFALMNRPVASDSLEQFYSLFDAAVGSGRKVDLIQAFCEYFRVTVVPTLDGDDRLVERVLQTTTTAPITDSKPREAVIDPPAYINCLPLLHSVVYAHLTDSPENPYMKLLYAALASFPPGWWREPLRASLGLRIAQPVTDNPAGSPIRVTAVRHNGPAWRAGVLVDDTIFRIAGTPNPSLDDVYVLSSTLSAGDAVTVTVIRASSPTPIDIDIIADAGPASGETAPPPLPSTFRKPPNAPNQHPRPHAPIHRPLPSHPPAAANANHRDHPRPHAQRRGASRQPRGGHGDVLVPPPHAYYAPPRTRIDEWDAPPDAVGARLSAELSGAHWD